MKNYLRGCSHLKMRICKKNDVEKALIRAGELSYQNFELKKRITELETEIEKNKNQQQHS